MSNTGKIFLVGFGPGNEAHMSYRAREAIAESDVVIGYSTYIKLVKELLDGKEVVRKGMTEELDRSIMAYEKAREGKTVALISSGDIGVYGMAGPTYEVLLQSGWTPQSGIEVEIVPGTTALSACASLVGAPLTHDFCSISLSDLLTPWPTIAKRIDAAGRSDFVIALYNPKSGRRTGQIVEAQRILLNHRKPDTPVAIVKSAYRDLQDIQMTTLDKMAEHKIGMLSTVLVGNSTTFVQEGLMITPRGYANKYDQLTGETHEAEKAGRSLTMGLEGWHEVVRKYLQETPQHSLHEVTRHFNAPAVEIAIAIAAADSDSPAGGYTATAIEPGRLLESLQACSRFDNVRAEIRAASGSVVELLLQQPVFTETDGVISIGSEHFTLQLDLSQLSQGWFVHHPENRLGLQLFNPQGESMLSLIVDKKEVAFNPDAIEHYKRAFNEYGLQPQQKVSSNE